MSTINSTSPTNALLIT